MKRLILIVAAMLAACPAFSARHTLFEGGSSEYTIVVASDAGESERFAAEELQYWIKEISGVTLPVSGLDGGRRGRRIVVGYNKLTGRVAGRTAPTFSDDGFTYRSRGGDIFIWGGARRGTLYGVYSFLETEFGCRWYSSKVSVAPARDSWSFEKLDHHETPGIRVRNVFYKDSFDPLWSARNRSNGTMGNNGTARYGGAESFWGGHTYNHFVSPAKYFDSHPEYFSEIDGKRISERTQLCLSNPEVFDLVVEGVRKVMREDPSHLIYSVGQNDWGNPCQCEKCRALKERYGGESGILIWFVNRVADAVRDEFPDKFIGTFAYMFTRTPPTDIRPRDNVVVRLCSIEECELHGMTDPDCPENASFRRDLEGWSRIAPHLFIWDYVATFSQYLAPIPNIWTFQDRIRCFRDNNAIGIMPQGNYQSIGTAFDDLKAYVLGKLMWNPDCDVDAVIDDFLNGYFGAAGPVIREYMEFERAEMVRPGLHEGCSPMIESNKLYSLDFALRGREIFKRAYAAVAGQPDYVARVERAELALCYLHMLYDPRGGYDTGALELMNRVRRRDNVTHLSEWVGWYNDFATFDRETAISHLIDNDCRDAGDIKLEGTSVWMHFKKARVDSAEPGSPEAQLAGSKLISNYFKGLNGTVGLYLFVHDFAGGDENANYHIEGTIVPDREYTAVCDGNWITEDVSLEGFDTDSDYMIAVSDVDPSQIRFKIVRMRPTQK